MRLNESTVLSELSGGLLRKVSLSHVFLEGPDLFLLNEFTNHLDMNTVK